MLEALLLCVVIGVSDGDTLKVRCESDRARAGTTASAPFGPPLRASDRRRRTITVRLAQIDAPEKRQAFGERSRANLALLCLRRPAGVRPISMDVYRRTVATVHCGGVDVSTEQVRAGMAWVYLRGKEASKLHAFEYEARAGRRGLWSDAWPVPPWEWRRQRGSR